ncbi:ETEC_3214 domain-containing protein [Streptomyces sp. NPDC060064]|uniref:ETEC_3214 domain-containing protein n=1 Tax=Streptomyces sp. NPDC060064 TaxID=3347049 RepID=UPI0036C53340
MSGSDRNICACAHVLGFGYGASRSCWLGRRCGGRFRGVRCDRGCCLGKRRRLIKAYRKLATYVRHDYVEGLFGEPAWEHKQSVKVYGADERDEAVLREVELTVRAWPLGMLGYLVTWCNEDGEVLMHSLTTRSRLFRPRVTVGPYRITLGRSRLADLPATAPEDFGPWPAVGARRFSYAEQHYFGNPGGYLHWVVGVSDVGSPASPPVGCNEWKQPQLADYREHARINSVLIVGSTIDLDSVLPYGIAPDHDRVRLLELRHPFRVALVRRGREAQQFLQRWRSRTQPTGAPLPGLNRTADAGSEPESGGP